MRISITPEAHARLLRAKARYTEEGEVIDFSGVIMAEVLP